ncbi:hypothetical protein EIN_221730 [Entamoeba invadens IP1]|uniref:Proteasome assembly chaperone 3 n=1 Tax=Entamoeba invadens IP1 TaxID=370355 RepID=A0A0A1U5E4_ENTIV|nr:hypothetical protein EIN_221730 [Entamoeba invadens IP1]ELP88050.1 hypothetical protein EIN_221730 [Entamoeba invadens IP1]|eukprot:XP_004254821.1 hypothetical protein EIN_221730 [Entamoeba invadens IP1]
MSETTDAITFKIEKGTERQYCITSSVVIGEKVDMTITQYDDSKTMMICLSDCNCFSQWIVCTPTTLEVRFGITNKVDPFNSTFTRQIMEFLNGVDNLVVAIGIKHTSREKLISLTNHVKSVLRLALKEINSQAKPLPEF